MIPSCPRHPLPPFFAASLLALAALHGGAQTPTQHGQLGIKGLTEPDDPERPAPGATEFRDKRYGVSFHVPAGWNFERKDGVLTTFRTEVRSARPRGDVRGVAAINYNPYPPTTFAGAAFYYSALPKSSAAECAAQATTAPVRPMPELRIAGASFTHGQDQQGGVCTESRDEIFTTFRAGACLRFDLVVNTFCAQSSGAMPINANQLADVNTRLAKILGSIHLDKR